jgi:hypothetical protein
MENFNDYIDLEMPAASLASPPQLDLNMPTNFEDGTAYSDIPPMISDKAPSPLGFVPDYTPSLQPTDYLALDHAWDFGQTGLRDVSSNEEIKE